MNIDQCAGHITIAGINCYFPPVPPLHTIQNFGRKKNDQIWGRTPLPIFRAHDIDVWDGFQYKPDDVVTFDDAWRQESVKRFGTDPYDVSKQGVEKAVSGVVPDPEYQMDCLASFVEQELGRIKNGHWIFINGVPVYITGTYYLYLNWWTLKDGPPEFRIPDLELMYLWEHVRRSKNFIGILYITIRGLGKSYLSGCISYYEAITKKNSRTTCQSLNDQSVGDWFRDKVLMPITKLPKFLIPINKHGLSDITSQSTFEMSPPSRRGMSVRMYNKLKDDALYSMMQTSIAAETGADGGTWDLLVQEEWAKVDPSTADTYKRLIINKFTVVRGNAKKGNIFAPSTVGEMASGGDLAFKAWQASDQAKLNDAGTTTTGLIQYFRSDLEGTCFDKFGNSVPVATDEKLQDYLADKYGEQYRHGAKAYHDAFRKSLTGADLVQYKQLNPRNIQEAFYINIDQCIYPIDILLNAKDRIINSGKQLVRRGIIKWKEIDKEAVWVDQETNHRWECSFLNFEPNRTQINEGRDKTFTPLASHERLLAMDPYSSMNLADENQGSLGAAAVYSRSNMHISLDYCDTITADYLFRPDDPFDFYEDMLAAAFFFGAPIFCEVNKSNFIDYCRKRGYRWGYENNPLDFVWERPASTFTKTSDKPTEGLYQTQGTIEHYTNATTKHLIDHGHKLKHLRVIEQWLKFNPKKTKKYDLAVAASMAIVGAERPGIVVAAEIELGNLIRTYNNSGSSSLRN